MIMRLLKFVAILLVVQTIAVQSVNVIVPLETDDSAAPDNSPTMGNKDDMTSTTNDKLPEETQEPEVASQPTINNDLGPEINPDDVTSSPSATIQSVTNTSSELKKPQVTETTPSSIPHLEISSESTQTVVTTPAPFDESTMTSLTTLKEITTSTATKNDLNSFDTVSNGSLKQVINRSNDMPPLSNPQSFANKEDEPMKIPMTCISNYLEYCATKFSGFKFQDGCRNCKCTKNQTNFCNQDGPCEYFADSFEHATTYCMDVNNQNDKDYKYQLKKRVLEGRLKMQTKELKKETIKLTPISNERELSKPKLNGLLKAIKSKENIILKKSFMPNNETLIKNVKSQTKIHILENKKISERMSKKEINNQTDSSKSILVKASKTNAPVKNGNVHVKINLRIFKNHTMKGLKDETDSGNDERQIPKKRNNRGRKIAGKVNLIKSSLKKMSDKKRLRNLIYCIAHNDLGAQKIDKNMEKYSDLENKKTKLYIKRLGEIKEKNLKLKEKCLEIVKIKLKLSKSHYGQFNHQFDPMFFKRMIKKCNRLNEELHEMKGGVKTWFKMYKKVSHHPGYLYSGAGHLQVSLAAIILLLLATFV